MIQPSKFTLMLLAVVLPIAIGTSALAENVPVGVGGSPPTAFIATWLNPNEHQVDIGSAAAPIQIYLDPSEGSWLKTITLDYPLGANGILAAGDVIHIDEFIQIVPSPQGVDPLPLTDWHEQVFEPFFEFQNAEIFIPELGINVLPTPSAADVAWFDFIPPILPGQFPITLVIQKDLVYTGPTVFPADGFTIRVEEFPTVPEPSSIFLGGITFLAFCYCLWRKRRVGIG